MNPDTARSTREPGSRRFHELLERERADMAWLVHCVAVMYDEISGGLIGKPMTYPGEVVGQFYKRMDDAADERETELRRSLAEKVRTLPVQRFYDERRDYIAVWAVLRLIEGSDPASPEDDEEGIKADIRQASMGGPDFTPATWPEEHQHEPYCLTCDASLPATPVAGSTIPPLDVAEFMAILREERAAVPRGPGDYWMGYQDGLETAMRRVETEAARLAGSTETEEPNWRKVHEEAGGDGHTGEYE